MRDLRSARLSRWFQEGHAEWVGLQVTRKVLPDMVDTRRGELERQRAMLPEPNLAAWGGMRVTEKALQRQISPADRKRRATDPSYIPSGPFSFGPGDFAEGNANQEGR